MATRAPQLAALPEHDRPEAAPEAQRLPKLSQQQHKAPGTKPQACTGCSGRPCQLQTAQRPGSPA